MARQGLTKTQKKLFTFICSFINEEGIAPTYQEMADHMEVVKSTAYSLTTRLVNRGFIGRASGHRNMWVIK